MAIHLVSRDSERSWPEILTSAPLLVIYKHSPVCGVSSVAREEVEEFARAVPDVPVYQVDVIRQRGVSRAIAAELRIGHESPQVIAVCDGKAVWATSHVRIKAATLAEEIAKARAACRQPRRAAAGR